MPYSNQPLSISLIAVTRKSSAVLFRFRLFVTFLVSFVRGIFNNFSIPEYQMNVLPKHTN